MQLALLNLAIDSKLRASDLLRLHVYDVSSQGVIYERVQCIQQKTGTDVHYEITPRTQQSPVLLEQMLPVIIKIMMDSSNELWGDPVYPLIEK